MNPQQKISLGAALASLAGTGIALSSIFGWTSLVRPWGFLIGFIFGMAAGAGVVLAIAGLIEHKRTK
jgi:F0F1-type ATP synthase assembly protein I